MKYLNLLLLFCLFAAHPLYGQPSYYYYGNNRIALEEAPERSGRDDACTVPTTDDGLVIYPNPTGGTLTVESASPIREITVYDLSGRVVVEAQYFASPQPQYTVNVSSLQNGLYLLKAVTDSGVQTARFVKN